MTEERELSLIAGPHAAAQSLDFVAEVCRAWGVHERALFDIQLAVDEAVSNIVQHGYSGRNGTIHLRVERAGQDVIIELTDQGVSFDPTATPEPDLSGSLAAREIGGLGIYFIRKVMDDVCYQQDERGNVLRLTKKKALP